MSITSDLKLIRQQLERAQTDLAGRESLGAITVWDGQNESSVYTYGDSFSGLIVHLTPEVSPLEGTEILSMSDLIESP